MAPQELAPDDYAGIHEVLAREHTLRYIKRAAPLSLARAVAYTAPYDPASDLSNYEKTYWDADPNKLTNPAAYVALSALTGLRPKTIERHINSAVDARIDDIGSALDRGPLMYLTDHTPDVFAALPLCHTNKRLAQELPGDERQNHYARIHNTHVIATRGFVPLKIRFPGTRDKDTLSIVRAAQLEFAPHFTFPRTNVMLESGIPVKFINRYNARAKHDCIQAVRHTSYYDGLHQLWGMAPGAGPDIKGKKLKEKYPEVYKEHNDARVIRRVTEGTARLIQNMNCSIMPVYSKIVSGPGGTQVQLGEIIPPEKINLDVMQNIMRGMRTYRTVNGELNVYYEGDL